MSRVRDELNDEKMCSFSEHEVSDRCSYYGDDACGDCSSLVPTKSG